MPSNLSGAFIAGAAQPEGGHSVLLATFTDSNLGDSIADLSASIDWGDGTTETSVILSNGPGAFSVQGEHTYADEGSFHPIVTLSHLTGGVPDGDSATASGTLNVVEADELTVTPTTFHVNSGQAFTGTVATFTDAYSGQVASDLTATIVWGDGTTDAGTITGSGGSFSVSGTHTYAAAGSDTVVVTVTDDAPEAATAMTNSMAVVGFPGTLMLIPQPEGVQIVPSTLVAFFSDSDSADTAANFKASIDWGDGTTTPGVIAVNPGLIAVLADSSGHTYSDEGKFTPIVTLSHLTAGVADGVTGTATATVNVAEADTLIASPTVPLHISEVFSGEVATFSDLSNPGQVASDFTATIDWGDGTTDVGAAVSGGGGTFTVSGTHTYVTAEQDSIAVTLTDDAPGTATATAVNKVDVGFFGNLSLTAAVEGVSAGGIVATFSDPNLSDLGTDFTATINWGDGTTTGGTVAGAVGTINVLSTGHTYADEGNFSPIVTLTHSADSVTHTATGSITVADRDILKALPGPPIAPSPNQPFSGVLGIFTDANPSAILTDFTVTIDWGDGTTSAGTLTGGTGGPFTVSGTHAYATSGADTIVTTSSDDAPGTAQASIVTNVVVGLPGAFTLNTATEDTPIAANTTVASFSDGNLGDLANGFTATIDWGDGTTTEGTVVGGAGLFAIDGGHTYRVEGNFQATATLTRASDNNKGVASGTIAVGEGPTIPEDFAGTGFSGVLWRQSNPQTFGQNFVQWSMNGANVAASQSDTFQGNVILPDASWSVRGTGDFDGDGRSDILWQHSDGSLTAWLMNDSTIVSDGPLKSQGQIVAPNSSWSVAGTGDFDGDARDDILWRKADGSLQEWLMNGTTITSAQTPTFHGAAVSPDASWSVAAMGDFDGDGHQDILWRNSSSNALQDWSMNGGTVTTSQAPTFPGGAVTPDSSWSIVAAGDFNRDNKTDLLWRQAGTGLLQEWQMNGSQIVSSQVIKFQGSQVTPDSRWSVVEIGDFNGDGKSDVLWRQTTTGALSEWLMDGAQITASNTVNSALDSSWQVQSKPTVFV